MNIVIITTFFPPNLSIAAVRPYMFSKYLTEMGHNVTVLYSCEEPCSANESNHAIKGLNAINYTIQKNKKISSIDNVIQNKNKLNFLKKTKDFIYSHFGIIRTYVDYKKFYSIFNNFFIPFIKENDKLIRNADLVITSYGNLENLLAGLYIDKVFNTKWIIDFRDKVANYPNNSFWEKRIYYKFEKECVLRSDTCTTISNGLTKYYKNKYPSTDIKTLYNGYDSSADNINNKNKSKNLILCYTGTLYNKRLDGLSILLEAINKLINNKMINPLNLQFVYAGVNGDKFKKEIFSHKLNKISKNLGEISRTKAEDLQLNSDIYTMFSWNTKEEKGILTGKFYEGIRANKPILACITGECPNSELYQLNQKYNYGFCYEQARGKNAFDELCNWILKMYNEKMQKGYIDFNQSDAIKEKFHYKNLTKELEQICINLLDNK